MKTKDIALCGLLVTVALVLSIGTALAEGESRPLTEAEIARLRALVNMEEKEEKEEV